MCTRAAVEEKGKASATERWRKQSHLGTPDLVLMPVPVTSI